MYSCVSVFISVLSYWIDHLILLYVFLFWFDLKLYLWMCSHGETVKVNGIHSSVDKQQLATAPVSAVASLSLGLSYQMVTCFLFIH